MKRYQHLNGLNHRFIKLEGRDYWLPLNDDSWADASNEILGFLFTNENFYTFPQDEAAQQQAERLLFREIAATVTRQQLDSEALTEIARDLKAIYAEQDMEHLIDSIHHYLKQDDLF